MKLAGRALFIALVMYVAAISVILLVPAAQPAKPPYVLSLVVQAVTVTTDAKGSHTHVDCLIPESSTWPGATGSIHLDLPTTTPPQPLNVGQKYTVSIQ